MAEISFPWEDIDTTETQYSQLFRNLNNGVNGTPATDDVEVVAGFVGLTVDVEPGQAMVQGHYYINTVAKNIELDVADPVNPRIDTIVLRLDDIANEITAVAVTGTPAVSPEPPALTQTQPYGVFEFPLADVEVPAGAGVPGTITDRREFMGERFGVWTTDLRPDPGTGVAIGYNTTLDVVEFYDGTGWRPIREINELNDVSDVNLTTPTSGDKLVFDGTNWVNLEAYAYVDTVYFTSSGTFSKADYPWLRAIRVKCQGGGGAGGGAAATDSVRISGGTGGSGGNYAESFITDIFGLDASVAVTRGAGGTGVAGQAGNNGDESSFGSLVRAPGGGGGIRSGAATFTLNAAGGVSPGVANAGDLEIRGGSGENLYFTSFDLDRGAAGNGGSSVLGGAGLGRTQGVGNGFGGVGFGGGGGGGLNARNNGTARSGGVGADGIVIVELYA